MHETKTKKQIKNKQDVILTLAFIWNVNIIKVFSIYFTFSGVKNNLLFVIIQEGCCCIEISPVLTSLEVLEVFVFTDANLIVFGTELTRMILKI